MLVELSVLLFDSCGEFICGKGSSLIAYRVDWCVKHRLQFVSRPKEEEEKKRKRKIEISVYNCSSVFLLFWECCWVENHLQTMIRYLTKP